MSTSTFGDTDLDLRPPELERSTLSVWLQECPNCGFVSSDLSAPEAVQEVMATERFTHLQNCALSGTFIGRCLKRSFLDERLANLEDAAEHALWAAWSADDADSQAAVEYRSKAANLLLEAAALLPTESIESVTTKTRTVDILRRAGRWEEAIGLADALLLKDDLDPTLRSVVAFGRRLAQARDRSGHTVRDALSH
jgi:hypothetical protein